jgi:site-specific DNA-methyltransferase (adenine-specific)
VSTPCPSSQLILGDCLEVLPTLPAESVDLVLTDPPYFLTKLDQTWDAAAVGDPRNRTVVSSLPATMRFNRRQGADFYDWYLEVSRELFRVLKPGGFFFSFSAPRLYHRMASAIDDAGFELRDQFLWLYTQNQAKAMSLNHVIDRLHLSAVQKRALKQQLNGWKTPQLKSCFEPIALAQRPVDGNYLHNALAHQVGLLNTQVKVGLNMYPANLLLVDALDETLERFFLIAKPTKEEKHVDNDHPTVKPVALCQHLIRLATLSPDAVVLDPFIGSGTTAVAAQLLGRRFTGIDRNPDYLEIARTRLDAAAERSHAAA